MRMKTNEVQESFWKQYNVEK